MHETYSEHKDGSFANELWRFHKNWRSSTRSVKDDRTKLLLKLLIPWSSSVKTVSVYLKQNLLKEQNFCDVSGNHAMCLLLEWWQLQPFLREIATSNFLEWRRFAQWKLIWLGWDFEVEPWKDSCCSMREASVVVGDQDGRHSICEQTVS